jgi:hypothetical protein
MARVVEMEGSEGIIAFVEVRRDRLVGVINFDAVMQPMNMAVIRVNKKVRLIADTNIETLAEQVVKEVVVFVQAPPEIAEINANPSLHRESIGAFPRTATVFSRVADFESAPTEKEA